MKITNVTFCFLLCVTSVVAQKNQGQNRIQNLSKLEIGFQGIGYGYETGLGNNLAIDFTGGLGGDIMYMIMRLRMVGICFNRQFISLLIPNCIIIENDVWKRDIIQTSTVGIISDL
jgi:hypothetical protein